jgi:hypothetical protein
MTLDCGKGSSPHSLARISQARSDFGQAAARCRENSVRQSRNPIPGETSKRQLAVTERKLVGFAQAEALGVAGKRHHSLRC